MYSGDRGRPQGGKGARRLLREPLLQFMALGALIFLGAGVFGSSGEGGNRRIVVDEAVAARLASLYEKQMGSAPDKVQLANLVDNYIEEEVLYREALRLGLDRDDEIVRRRLVQKMRFLAARGFDEPGEEALTAYYQAHREEFLEPAKVSFRHIYFSPDADGAEAAKARARDVLARLQGGCETGCGEQGDPFPLQMRFSRLAPLDAVQLFGSTELADALFTAEPGRWTGPFASGYGWHLVHVSDRQDEHVPSYDEIEEKVRAAYARDSSARQTDEAIAEMAADYDIVRTTTETGP